MDKQPKRHNKRRKEKTMNQKISEVMTSNPVTMPVTASVLEAARAMRDSNIGAMVVLDHGKVYGIATDRDIVVRAVAQGRDLATTRLKDICSHDLTMLSPTDTVEHAVEIMREKAIRRLPVVENGKPVGIVSLGDLAVERDPDSALGNISAAPATR
jgi:CBS domain-containing protein